MADFPTVPLLSDADYFLRNLAQCSYLNVFSTAGHLGDKILYLTSNSCGCLAWNFMVLSWHLEFLHGS